MDRDADKKPWRKEPILAAMAFVSAFLALTFLGTIIAVGTGAAESREAALWMLAPAALVAAACACFGPTRRFFLLWWG